MVDHGVTLENGPTGHTFAVHLVIFDAAVKVQVIHVLAHVVHFHGSVHAEGHLAIGVLAWNGSVLMVVF